MPEEAIVTEPDSKATRGDMFREIAQLRDIISTRLDAMDRAIELFQANLVRVPTDTQREVAHLKELHDEKFASIAIQFNERDTRVKKTGDDAATAVTAALQAAKEAVGEQNRAAALSIAKSEASTSKQIEASDDKIDDLKERLSLIEGQKKGSGDSMAWVIAAVGALIGIAALIVSLTRGR